MALNDPLANALSIILNAEGVSKRLCEVKSSATIKKALSILNENGYLGEPKEVIDGRGNHITVQLMGKINKCGAIKPRYPVKVDEFKKFEKRYLIAQDFGILIISTPKGMMTHKQAREQNLGGRLIAYCY